MSDDIVIPLPDEGLGNQAYLVDLGDGRALAVDPSVDLRSLDRVAAQRGLTVSVAAETHLHADFVSGAVRLARRDGARAVGSSAGRRAFEHVGVEDGSEVGLGGLTLGAWTTPGHTDEHVSYLLMDGDRTVAVFTGGSLIVGAAARTDLVAPERTDELARAQFWSLKRLAQLPDETPVYPTHGAGSFCSAPPGADRITTIGREKATNALLAIQDEDEFVKTLVGSLGSYPSYFARLGEVNRRGPSLPGEGPIPTLSVAEVVALRNHGAVVIDVRPVPHYIAAHVPSSVAIPLRPDFATWLGWTVPGVDIPLVIVRNPDQDLDEVLWQARKVGYDSIIGELVDGLASWIAADLPVASHEVADPARMQPERTIDVRQRSEFASERIPGATNVELGALVTSSLPEGPLVVMCGHGERAATAASLLEREGRTEVSVLEGGPADWLQVHDTSSTDEP